jgi:hypothetical protein
LLPKSRRKGQLLLELLLLGILFFFEKKGFFNKDSMPFNPRKLAFSINNLVV